MKESKRFFNHLQFFGLQIQLHSYIIIIESMQGLVNNYYILCVNI